MKYPKYTIYEKIYKRYFKRDVCELIELANIKNGDRVLDVCGGNGRLTRALVDNFCDVSYVDQEKNMIPLDLKKIGVNVYHMSIEDFIKEDIGQFDKVFCQQAINYWLLNIDMEKFSELFKKNGLFIFNTFINKPTEVPMIKKYILDENEYLEVSYLVKDKVFHIQICEGYEPHFTVFDWIDEETYREILEPYFSVECLKDKKTAIYVCRRK